MSVMQLVHPKQKRKKEGKKKQQQLECNTFLINLAIFRQIL
jgi:hypothetical protein